MEVLKSIIAKAALCDGNCRSPKVPSPRAQSMSVMHVFLASSVQSLSGRSRLSSSSKALLELVCSQQSFIRSCENSSRDNASTVDPDQ